MPLLSWLTDPHLNFLTPGAMRDFAHHLAEQCPDGLVITGDIAESPSVTSLMEILDQTLRCPVYFVLGNHDYYFGSIGETRERVRSWARQTTRCRWLPDSGVISLSDSTALVGHGAWSDGRVGDFMGSPIWINDYRHIADLVCDSKQELHRRLKELGDEGADAIGELLSEALESHRHVIVATHSPPFAEACWHDGKAEVGEWTPHFTCEAVGRRLVEIMETRTHQSLQVICGHTHGEGQVQIRPNIHVRTGGAIYEAPDLQSPIVYI